jgi:hypothetical protein
MLVHLRKVADTERIKITDDALQIIVRRGGGSFRDSLSLLDQISTLSDKEITKELVVSAMGLPEDEKIAELLAEYINGDVVKITTLLKDLLSSGVKPETLAEEMIAQIIAEPKPELLSLLAKLPEVKAPFPEAKLLVALAGKLKASKPVFPEAGLEFLSTSYAGQPAEPSLRDEPVGDVRNIRVKNSNQNFMRPKKQVSATPSRNTLVRLRHRAPLIPAEITLGKNNTAVLEFENEIKRPAAGQSAVIYDGEICLGGGIIR